MKHIYFLLLIIGTAFTTACATNETSETSEPVAEATPASNAASESTPAAPTAPAASQTTAAPAASSSSSDGDSNDVTYTCTHDGSVRTIRVLYHEAGTMVCEVTYEKASGTQSLWNAANDDTYCTPKAEAFVAKQEGWGWSCNKE